MTPDPTESEERTAPEAAARGPAPRHRRRAGEDPLPAPGSAGEPAGLPPRERPAPGGRRPGRRDRDPRRHRLRAGRPARPRPPGPPGGDPVKDPLQGERGFERSRAPEDEETRDESYAGVWERLAQRTPGLLGRARQRREEVESLYEELMREEPARQLRRVREPRFQSLALLDWLLEESHEQQISNPARGAQLARLALRLGTSFRTDRTGSGRGPAPRLLPRRQRAAARCPARRRRQPAGTGEPVPGRRPGAGLLLPHPGRAALGAGAHRRGPGAAGARGAPLRPRRPDGRSRA